MSDSDLKRQLDKMDLKLDKLDSRLDSVDVTLAKQSVILEEHMRRSLANEEQVEILKKKFDTELQPLKTHVIQSHTVFKLVGVLATLATITKVAMEVLSYVSSR